MQIDLLRQALHSQPFKTFAMCLVDGRRLDVVHPDFVAASRRHVIHVHHETEQVTWIEPGLILTLDFKNGAPSPPVEKKVSEDT